MPIDLTAGSGSAGSSAGIPTDLVNQNPFPVSADEQLTVSGDVSLASARVKPHVICHASAPLKPFAAVAVRIALNATGRALLRKHALLHATLTVSTRAAGKPAKTVTRHLLLRAR